MESRGYVQVYTGDGKGKTTAALGLALRAVGAGWRVFFAQFAKGMVYSEWAALDKMSPSITARQFGQACFIGREPKQGDYDCAERGLMECKEAAASGEYQLLVLDEANVAVALGLLPLEDLIQLIDSKPRELELVITGRWAHREVTDRADLVTEMQEVKHYYHQGVLARDGIEK